MPRGSGATSRAFSAYARQFLEMMQKPDVEHIDGLSPAISIEQKTTSRNPRSTVATVTEIYDYMRLLWARVGIPYSPATGLPIEAQQVSQMVDRVMALPEGSRHYLLAPVVRGRKGEYRKELAEWQKAGFQRVRIDGEFYAIEDAPALDKKYKHDIEVVVDRIVVREGIEPRLADSFETALKLAEGLAYLDPADPPPPPPQRGGGRGRGLRRREAPQTFGTPSPYPLPAGEREKSGMKLDYGAPGRILFSEKFACPVSGFTIAEIEPRLFTFNAPQGACPACDGLGEKLVFDEDLVVPNHASSIAKGAVVPWAKSNPPSPYYMQVLSSLARAYDFDLHVPWKDLPEEAQRRDPPRHPRPPGHPPLHRRPPQLRGQEAVRGRASATSTAACSRPRAAWMREELSRYQCSRPCEVCHGARLKPEALAVKIAGEDISLSSPPQRRRRARLVRRAPREAHRRPRTRSPRPSSRRSTSASASSTMSGSTTSTSTAPAARFSGGESQRIRLASPDRQRPLGRPLRPRRALDRPPPEGQRPPARDAQAPARPRQHRARGRA